MILLIFKNLDYHTWLFLAFKQKKDYIYQLHFNIKTCFDQHIVKKWNIKNICTLDAFCFLIEKLLSCTCYYTSLQYNFFMTSWSRYKLWSQPTSITHFMYFEKKNTIVKWHIKIHIYIKILLYLNLWWPWFDNNVQHANALTFL